MQIGDNIQFNNSGFKFNGEVSSVFDEHIIKSIPCYTEVHNMIANMSDWFIEENTNIYDLGTATGKCISSINFRHRDKKVNFIGVDKSIEMIDLAKRRTSLLSTNFVNLDILNKKLIIENASIITSILTLQFIPIQDRLSVVNKVYNGLNKGGAFIVFEKIEVDNPMLNRIYLDVYSDFKLTNGFSAEEVVNKSKAIRGVMRPLSIDENLKIFKNAGFRNVDIFFKWCNFIGFILIK